MRGVWPIVYFASIALVAIGLSCWATRVLLGEPDVPRLQRGWQLVLIWVVPVVGAVLVVEMHRPSRRRRVFLTADEIHPMLNQALQPAANAATRAAEGFIEQEAFDAAVDHFTDHSGVDGSH
jgi:Tfp pilus assembly protein PilX